VEPFAGDRLRSWTLGAACAGFVGIPCLGALLGEGEQTRRYDTPITPPDYAFAVWAPIFAGCVASTIAQCRPGGRGQEVSRRTGWPLAGAYAVNAAWSLAAQNDRFALTPVLLPVATGGAAAAFHRLQPVRSSTAAARATAVSTGLLLGWTALASVVNIAASRPDRNSPRTVGASTAGLLAVCGLVAGVVARSERGALPLAAAAGWGLATTAATAGKPAGARAAAAFGAAGVLIAAGGRLLSRSAPGPFKGLAS
jgi:hypothetical protein